MQGIHNYNIAHTNIILSLALHFWEYGNKLYHIPKILVSSIPIEMYAV